MQPRCSTMCTKVRGSLSVSQTQGFVCKRCKIYERTRHCRYILHVPFNSCSGGRRETTVR